jgi:uncharacterized phage protein (TIGR01671 family)
MREIKFRIWVEDKMHIPLYIRLPITEGIPVMQYTGLHDSKRTEEYPEGQEIYEGDILRYVIIGKGKIEFIPCEVYFDMGAFYMKDTRMHGREDLLSEAEPDDIEVIGNIHENSELLKGKA